jgi:hypothetical protein
VVTGSNSVHERYRRCLRSHRGQTWSPGLLGRRKRLHSNHMPAEKTGSPLEPLHRFHPYCARFPSEIAESAIVEYTRRGESVYDPFCGSGTSLAAGLMLQRRVVGSDIDVLAGMLSAMKCGPRKRVVYLNWRRSFDRRVELALDTVARHRPPDASPSPGSTLDLGPLSLALPHFPELNYWFPPRLIAFLSAIAQEAHSNDVVHLEDVALASLSASIISKSHSWGQNEPVFRPSNEIERMRHSRARVLL